MECKARYSYQVRDFRYCIDLTRMECKVFFQTVINLAIYRIDLTRMECKDEIHGGKYKLIIV